MANSAKDVRSYGLCNKRTRLISSTATNRCACSTGTTARVFNRHGGSHEELFAGLVFLSAAPHPVCAGSADTARKNAGAIAIRVGLAGILSKATAGRVVRRDRVELVGGTWPQEYSGERGTPLRHRNGRFRNGRIGGAEAVRDLANALGPDGLARRYRQCGRLLASSDAAWIKGQLIPVSRCFRLSKKTAITA